MQNNYFAQDESGKNIISEKDEMAEIKDLLKENLKYQKATYVLVDKTRKYIQWLEIFAAIKFFLILIILILALIYLPPIISKVFSSYQELLGVSSSDLLTGLLK